MRTCYRPIAALLLSIFLLGASLPLGAQVPCARPKNEVLVRDVTAEQYDFRLQEQVDRALWRNFFPEEFPAAPSTSTDPDVDLYGCDLQVQGMFMGSRPGTRFRYAGSSWPAAAPLGLDTPNQAPDPITGSLDRPDNLAITPVGPKPPGKVEPPADQAPGSPPDYAAIRRNHRFLSSLAPSSLLQFSRILDQLTPQQTLASLAITGYLLDNDRQIFHDLDQILHQSTWLANTLDGMTWMGEGMYDFGIAGLLYLWGTEKSKLAAEMAAEALLYSGIQVQIIKRIVGVPRPSDPDVRHLGPSMTYDDFPSGHTSNAFAMATILGEVYNIGWLTYPMAGMVGLSRITQHTHWPSDIFAGYLVGYLGACEVMDQYGFRKARRYTSGRFGTTSYWVDGGLDYGWDDNASFSSSHPTGDKTGVLTLAGVVNQPLGSTTLAQVAYAYHRRGYDAFPQNSWEDTIVYLQVSQRLGDATFLQGRYGPSSFHVFNLDNPYDIDQRLDYVRETHMEFNLMTRLGNSLFVRAGVDFPQVSYPRFTGLDVPTATRWQFELGTTPRPLGDWGGRLQYAQQDLATSDAYWSARERGFAALVDGRISRRMKLQASWRAGQRDYLRALDPGGSLLSENWNGYGLDFKYTMNENWDLDLGYSHRSNRSGRPDWTYSKNIYTAGLTIHF